MWIWRAEPSTATLNCFIFAIHLNPFLSFTKYMCQLFLETVCKSRITRIRNWVRLKALIQKRLSILMQKSILCCQIKPEHADSAHYRTLSTLCAFGNHFHFNPGDLQNSNTRWKLRRGWWSSRCEMRCFVSIVFFHHSRGKNQPPLCFLQTAASKILRCSFGQRLCFWGSPHPLAMTVAAVLALCRELTGMCCLTARVI